MDFFRPIFAPTLRLRNSYPQQKNDGNSCNIQMGYSFLNCGVFRIPQGWSPQHKIKRWKFCIHILYRELGVHTIEKLSYSKHEYSSICEYIYIYISQAIFASKLKWNQPPTPEKKETQLQPTVTPTLQQQVIQKKTTKTQHHPTSKHQKIEFDTHNGCQWLSMVVNGC